MKQESNMLYSYQQQQNQRVQQRNDMDEDELQAIYDVDGAIKNFQRENVKAKEVEVQDPVNLSGVDISIDESNNTEIDQNSNFKKGRGFGGKGQQARQKKKKK